MKNEFLNLDFCSVSAINFEDMEKISGGGFWTDLGKAVRYWWQCGGGREAIANAGEIAL